MFQKQFRFSGIKKNLEPEDIAKKRELAFLCRSIANMEAPRHEAGCVSWIEIVGDLMICRIYQ